MTTLRRTFILCAAAFAVQNVLDVALGDGQQVAAVGTKYQGSNCCHFPLVCGLL